MVWLQRAWDETPVCLSFGRLTSMCLPLARVWWRDVAKGKAAPAKLITMEEWLRRDLGRQPQSGVLQLLGQTSKLRWATPSPSGVGLLHQQTLLRPPVFMSRNNASTIFQALDDSLGSLNFDALVETANSVPFVLVSLCGDLDSANVRCKHWFAARAASANLEAAARGTGGYIGIIDAICLAHVVHRIFELCFKAKTLAVSSAAFHGLIAMCCVFTLLNDFTRLFSMCSANAYSSGRWYCANPRSQISARSPSP